MEKRSAKGAVAAKRLGGFASAGSQNSHRIGMAFFQDNKRLPNWVNQQPLARTVNCLGDGQDGVWKSLLRLGQKIERERF